MRAQREREIMLFTVYLAIAIGAIVVGLKSAGIIFRHQEAPKYHREVRTR